MGYVAFFTTRTQILKKVHAIETPCLTGASEISHPTISRQGNGRSPIIHLRMWPLIYRSVTDHCPNKISGMNRMASINMGSNRS